MARSLQQQLNRIAKIIDAKAKEVLNTTVADEVIQMGKSNVQTVVYDAYRESQSRTGQLRDSAWMTIPVECGVIIRSDRTDGNVQVSHIVESGYGYSIPDMNTPLKYGFPRPFMQVTREQIQNSNIVENILAREISKDLGVKCRVR